MLINLTIAYNFAALYGGGLYCESSAEPVGDNLIVWGNSGLGTSGQVYELSGSFNTTYSCVEGGWSGIGNISEDPDFVPGPDGDFYLSQIVAGQTVQSPCVDTGDPATPLIGGTTRTDGVQDADIVDMGYHYPAFSLPSPLTIALTPYDPPIVIPAGGGSFDFNLEVENTGANPETFDIWTMATLPNGTRFGPIIIVPDFTAPPSWSINRDRTQAVPGNAPAGMYTYDAYVGEHPDDIWDEDHFDFEKLSVGDERSVVSGWKCWGEPFNSPEAAMENVATNYVLLSVYPNPFNPITNIDYAIPDPGEVNLYIFDITGQLVAVLVNGWRDAGMHEVTFDGSGLASGIYTYRLEAGDFIASGKMVLVK